ncbi:hypothetical protein J437_LFUL001275 [Ladona fulva]|uniref:ISXO2-like transposase domain-containing protein n=1 Tax=Ladona fulva TaxID=123851 RepID=A0A8K0NU86_LADFU|nr:hypothetical protein J437_LFUL001275 [Ladona fulva]
MIPSLEEFMLLFGDDEKTIQSLISCDIIHPTRTCNKCGLTTYVKVSRQTYRCNKKSCRNEVTVRTGTFFALSKLPISKIMLLGYLWLTQIPVSSAASMTGCSNHTVCDIYQYYRKLVSNHLDFQDVQIGGEGVIVEVDETKLARRKYERSQSVDDIWVVGGVEKSADRKVFLVPIESRDPASLATILERHVLPGSIIQTNLWNYYSGLSESSMKKEEPEISYSVCSNSPAKHFDINTLRGTWEGLKQNVARRNRTTERIEEHLWEFIWRSKHADDAWDGLLFALKEVFCE